MKKWTKGKGKKRCWKNGRGFRERIREGGGRRKMEGGSRGREKRWRTTERKELVEGREGRRTEEKKKELRKYHTGEKKPVESRTRIVRPVLALCPGVSWINLGPQPQLALVQRLWLRALVNMTGFFCAYLLSPKY